MTGAPGRESACFHGEACFDKWPLAKGHFSANLWATSMTRRYPDLPLASVTLHRSPGTPLYQQLYGVLKQAILTGQLHPGRALPSSRALAAALGVARNTVLAVYEQLRAEGYLEARVGSGTRVARSLPDQLPALQHRASSSSGATEGTVTLSKWGRRAQQLGAEFRQIWGSVPDAAPRPFQSGVPAVDLFPAALFGRYVARQWRQTSRTLLQYGDPAGFPALRDAVASYVGAARGVRCTPEQVIIVGGTQQGVSLAVQLLAEPGDCVWIEDPGFPGARSVFQCAGLKLVPREVDAEGMVLPSKRQRTRSPRLIYVTPSHQFPLGMTMTLSRRLALLDLAARVGAWIFEDDYDSEYRFTGPPIPSLQGLADQGRVIYFGSFSKVLAPALRLGYLIVPAPLIEPFRAARALTDRHPPTHEQAALANFIADGHFEGHVRRMRSVYHERHRALVEHVARDLADTLEIESSATGLHLVGWLPPGVDDRRAARRAAAAGVVVTAVSTLALCPPSRGGLVMSYGGFTPVQIRAGVTALARALIR